MKIVADSSSNVVSLKNVKFTPVPLKIITDYKEYIDTPETDVPKMLKELKAYQGKSGTSCPNVNDWLEAFGDEDEVYAVSLTSKLSGGYNAATIAAEDYMDEHPGRKVFVLDSLTTGPELELLVEKYEELILAGRSFEEIGELITEYRDRTQLAFILGSLGNFAKNGRVSPALAKITDVLHIHIVGRASDVGDLEPLNKCRGEQRSIEQLWKNMKASGYYGGKVRIRHSENITLAKEMEWLIRKDYPDADVTIAANLALCSFYAEAGGLLVGYETGV